MSFVVNGQTIPYGLMVGRKRIIAASVGNSFCAEGKRMWQDKYADKYFKRCFRLYVEIPQNDQYAYSTWRYCCYMLNFYQTENNYIYAKVGNDSYHAYFFKSYDSTPVERGVYVAQDAIGTRVEFSEYDNNKMIRRLAPWSGQYYCHTRQPLSKTKYKADPFFHMHTDGRVLDLPLFTMNGPYPSAILPYCWVGFAGTFGDSHKTKSADYGYAQIHYYFNGQEFFTDSYQLYTQGGRSQFTSFSS